MDTDHCRRPYTGPVQAVILDWAGTAVDYGSIGPVAVFLEVFDHFDVPVTTDETRRFMGLAKKEHIRQMCALASVRDRWRSQHGREPQETDVEAMYRQTEKRMVAAIAAHADAIPGLLDIVAELRRRRIRIGSTTGYTAPMMAELGPAAASKGYAPDVVVCASDVPAGRPHPWMCYKNAIDLQVYPLEAVVKIGDTVSDILEGCNAGMWTIGLTRSGNELGLTEAQTRELAAEELEGRLTEIRQRFTAAGADYTAEGIWAVMPLIDQIQQRLVNGEKPLQPADAMTSQKP
jgi:phosphonoacetaldehyde hydrolase